MSRIYDNNEATAIELLHKLYPDARIAYGTQDVNDLLAELGADRGALKWRRKPDAVVVDGDVVIIIEAKKRTVGGSVYEKLTNPVWRDVYWPTVFAGTGYATDLLYVLKGFVGHNAGMFELMDMLSIGYIHEEDHG